LTDNDKLDNILSDNSERYWFKRRSDGLVGIFGDLSLKYNSDDKNTQLMATGIAFYKE